MRKLIVICAAALLLAGCNKDKIVTGPCQIDVKIDWVRGSKAQYTITPENPNACFVVGYVEDGQEAFDWPADQLVKFQLDWMEIGYQAARENGNAASFTDMYGYFGARTIRSTHLTTGCDFKLIVFQINPQTRKAIGSAHIVPFHTLDVPEKDLTFRVQYKDDTLHIIPSNDTDSWFWEYESSEQLTGGYGSPYHFYYSIIDMYQQYGFLKPYHGAAEWVFSRDDPSVLEGEINTLVVSGLDDGRSNPDILGEITTKVYYANFYLSQGKLHFVGDTEISLEELK